MGAENNLKVVNKVVQMGAENKFKSSNKVVRPNRTENNLKVLIKSKSNHSNSVFVSSDHSVGVRFTIVTIHWQSSKSSTFVIEPLIRCSFHQTEIGVR